MNCLSRIWIPLAATAMVAGGIVSSGTERLPSVRTRKAVRAADTVIYPVGGYKLRRNAQMSEEIVRDSLSGNEADFLAGGDTLPVLSARDTIKVPDSLRYSDPFRFRYYVALLDSLTHVQVRDSLYLLQTTADSLDAHKIDSIYVSDSTFRAKEKFRLWYASLSREERKKYDLEVKGEMMKARLDSIRNVKEEKQAIRDSIIENTPRVLETFYLPDSMQFKRIVAWKTSQDFHKMDVYIPDTTYNYRFYDYPFQRKDVNASWLGVAGSAVQYYNFFNRSSLTDVEFYKAHESWSFTPGNLPHYNTKTPYTELSYFGTLLASDAVESDNLHLFTTQNITPAFNFSLLFDRFGGGGMLENEETINKTAVVQANYLGKKYLMHFGYIYNMVSQKENGGMTDPKWIRDTTVNAREIPINLNNASSKIKRHTFFLDQQLRIPFNFINKIKARKDSSYVFDSEELDRNLTSAFLGHSSEVSFYSRKYKDAITTEAGMDYYRNVFNYDTPESADSLRTAVVDNKVFLRLQPWKSDGALSKLDVGAGDNFKQYYSPSQTESLKGERINHNSFYLYAGLEGQIRGWMNWDAGARYVLFGHDAADFDAKFNVRFKFYPFRRDHYSPICVNAGIETNLKTPNYYEQRTFTNHFSWDNSFGKISTTQIRGEIDIPRWKMNAQVGYALLANNLYYDTNSIIRQNSTAMSVFSTSLRKEFVFGPVHLDNKALLQFSSNKEVVSVPLLALNLKYFVQFTVAKDQNTSRSILDMQLGINALWNTAWNSPAWNPNLGVFYNQTERAYTNGPSFDVFINMQWKRCCIFVKYQNAGKGWPMRKYDYFSSDRHIIARADGLNSLKLGIYWPFYIQPGKHGHSHSNANSGGHTQGLRKE